MTLKNIVVGVAFSFSVVLAACGPTEGRVDEVTVEAELRPRCGDNRCTGKETCSTCAEDCGSCGATAFCGDFVCNSNETCSSCASDCGTCSTTSYVPPVAKDCSVDVTAAFNSWLATVPDNSVIDLVGGCYLSQGTIDVRNRNGLTFDGHGATIKATVTLAVYSNRAQLAFWLGSNHVVQDLTLQGSNLSVDCAQPGGVSCYNGRREWDHNLRISGTIGVQVRRVNFKNAWGDAVAVAPGGSWDSQGNGAIMATDVTVSDSTVNTTGRMAFGCTGCRRFTVQDNVITNVGYHVVDVEVEAPAWHGDITLLRNTYSNVYLALISATTGEVASRGPYIIRDNIRTDSPVACGGEINIGSSVFRSGAVTITGNTLNALTETVHVANADSVTISNNTGRGGNGGCGNNAGAVVLNSGSASITANTFTNVAQSAITTNTPATVCGNSLNGSAYNNPVVCQ
jgi:hypothetical protein